MRCFVVLIYQPLHNYNLPRYTIIIVVVVVVVVCIVTCYICIHHSTEIGFDRWYI